MLKFKGKGLVKHLFVELAHHSPFTAVGAITGLTVALVFSFLTPQNPKLGEDIFHFLHPFHLFLSSTATTAFFWRHKKNYMEAFIVGFVGSVGICSISDVLIPYFGILPLAGEIKFHLCILVHPHIVIPPAILGLIVGILFTKKTQKSSLFSHGLHVFVSALASSFYMVAFSSLTGLLEVLPLVFLVLFIAVLAPCCTSDIIFPIIFVGGEALEEEAL